MSSSCIISLPDRLVSVAQVWADANSAPLSRIGKVICGDAAFFQRIETGKGFTIATLEKFATYLADGANWPEGRVPQEVIDFAHVVGVSADEAALSAGMAGDMSTGGVAA